MEILVFFERQNVIDDVTGEDDGDVFSGITSYRDTLTFLFARNRFAPWKPVNHHPYALPMPECSFQRQAISLSFEPG